MAVAKLNVKENTGQAFFFYSGNGNPAIMQPDSPSLRDCRRAQEKRGFTENTSLFSLSAIAPAGISPWFGHALLCVRFQGHALVGNQELL